MKVPRPFTPPSQVLRALMGSAAIASRNRLTGSFYAAPAAVPPMSYSMLESSGAPGARDPQPTSTGDGIQPNLSEDSLDRLVAKINLSLGGSFTVETSYAIRAIRATHTVRHRRIPGTRMAYVARTEVIDGKVPVCCIRGWSFFAELAIVDRRRVKRMARRYYGHISH